MEFLPRGVQLYDPEDVPTRRGLIFDSVKNAVRDAYPKTWGGIRMEIGDDLDYEGPDDFTDREKDAKLGNEYLTRRLRGTVRLYDDKTNDLLDEKRLTLMTVPWMSSRGTFLHGGSDYTSIMQQRLVPAPFARWTEGQQAEVHFNAKPGSGPSFRVLLEPDTAQMRLKVGPQASMHLYSILADMGVPEQQMRDMWGDEVFEKNKASYQPKALGQAYRKLVRPHAQVQDATREAMIAQIQEALESSQVLKGVAQQHLPNWHNTTKRASMSHALQWEKRAEFSLVDLENLARYLNENTGAQIPTEGTRAEIEAAIQNIVTSTPTQAAYTAAANVQS